MPFLNYPEEFEENVDKILDSIHINNDLKKYLKEKAREIESWVKGFMKKKFCCGMCSSSRIESKHRILKQYLDSGKRLSELFQVVKELEKMEISRMENEIERFRKKEKNGAKRILLLHCKRLILITF